MKVWIKLVLVVILTIFTSILLFNFPNRGNLSTERFKIFNDSTDLEERDFMQKADFWTKYSAGITSDFYISYEDNSIQAKTYIDRHRSWIKQTATDDKRLLNHELYHVKLTDVITYELNNKIKLHGYDRQTTKSKAPIYKRKLNRLQDQYDSESDHGLNRRLQLYWEYKIDSMLSQYVSYEMFDQAKGYFPKKPTPYYNIHGEDTFSGKRYEGIEIEFAIWKIYEIEIDSTAIDYWLANRLDGQNIDDITIHWTQNYTNSFVEGYSKDTLNKKNLKEVLFKDENNLLFVGRYTYPLDHSEDSIFIKKGDLFFNSIKIGLEQPL